MKLPGMLAWDDGKDRLIKSLHMLQLLEMVEQGPAPFLILVSIFHSVSHQYVVQCSSVECTGRMREKIGAQKLVHGDT